MDQRSRAWGVQQRVKSLALIEALIVTAVVVVIVVNLIVGA